MSTFVHICLVIIVCMVGVAFLVLIVDGRRRK